MSETKALKKQEPGGLAGTTVKTDAIEVSGHGAPNILGAIVELASNPNVDADKLEKLVRLQVEMTERQEARESERQFNHAFSKMQPQLPIIGERGEIYNKAGTAVVSTFAKFEDIIEAIIPILSSHGFSLSHESEDIENNRIRITGILHHEGGYSRKSTFTALPDESGFKNATQALKSTRSYGRRITTCDLLCLVTRGEDDDAQSAGRPEAPDGYFDWEEDMATAAEDGWEPFATAWEGSRGDYKDYAAKVRSGRWKQIKELAVSKKRAAEAAKKGGAK